MTEAGWIAGAPVGVGREYGVDDPNGVATGWGVHEEGWLHGSANGSQCQRSTFKSDGAADRILSRLSHSGLASRC